MVVLDLIWLVSVNLAACPLLLPVTFPVPVRAALKVRVLGCVLDSPGSGFFFFVGAEGSSTSSHFRFFGDLLLSDKPFTSCR